VCSSDLLAKRALYSANLYNGNISEFMRIGRDAIQLNPNDPELLSDFGKKMAIDVGLWEEGISKAKKALRLNPDPSPSYFVAIALQTISDGNYLQTLHWTDKMQTKDWPLYNIMRAIAHTHLKQMSIAKASLTALNVKSAKAAGDIIRGYRMSKPLEIILIQQIYVAFEYAHTIG